MKISTNNFGNYSIIKIEGSLTSEHTKGFENIILKLIDEKKHILIDFTELVFISSSILTILLSYHSKSKENSLKLHLFGVNKDISQLFSITEVSAHLNIFETQNEALQNL